jgi:hypothetical protein
MRGRGTFLDSLASLGGVMKLARMRKVFVDGEDVCAIYDTLTPSGVVPMSEWLRVTDGRITRLEVFFDPRRLPMPA